MPDEPPRPTEADSGPDWSRLHRVGSPPSGQSASPLVRAAAYLTLIVFLAVGGAGLAVAMPYFITGLLADDHREKFVIYQERAEQDSRLAIVTRAAVGTAMGAGFGIVMLYRYHGGRSRAEPVDEMDAGSEGRP